jgi:hypothetical protein
MPIALLALIEDPTIRGLLLAAFEKIGAAAIHEFEHRRDTDPDFLAQSDALRAQRAAIQTEVDRNAYMLALQALMAKPPAS